MKTSYLYINVDLNHERVNKITGGIQMQFVNSPVAATPHMGTLHPFLERIIDKKVENAALTIFEKIVDTFCRFIYGSYRERLDCRMKEIVMDDAVDDVADDVKTAQRVLTFMDGAPLYDRTATQRVEIKQEELLNLLTNQKAKGIEEIYIDGKPVYFNSNPSVKLLFGKQYQTEEMYVSDLEECPELVMIYERETGGNLKAWYVDTSQPTHKITQGGQLEIGRKEIFIAQSISLQTPPQPIVVSFP